MSAVVNGHGVYDVIAALTVLISSAVVVNSWLHDAATSMQKWASVPETLHRVDERVERLVVRTAWLSFLDPKGKVHVMGASSGCHADLLRLGELTRPFTCLGIQCVSPGS